MLTWFAGHVAWPLWEIDNGTRVRPALRELEASQWLPARARAELQWGRLQAILRHAYEGCRFYRDRFDTHGVHPETIASPADLQRLPLLTKQDLRRHGAALVHQSYATEDLILSKTGGSTGTSLAVYADRACRDQRNAAAIRSDRWAGWDVGVRRAALWGNPPVARTWRQKIRAVLHDRTIYLDTMNMNDETMASFVADCKRYRPGVLYGHSHSLYIWAAWLKRQGITGIRPRGIISTSMMLLPRERTVIEEVFGCRVTNRYGCEEVGLIACECERHDGLHLNTDHLYIECLRDDGSPAAPGEPSALVITDLMNRGMPLIRYCIEDVGVPVERTCPCGRTLPLLQSVVGRVADFLVRRDGSLVAGVSLVERTLTACEGLEQMQIVQEDVNELLLHVVPASTYGPQTEEQLTRELRDVFGQSLRVRISPGPRLPQQASGKYRFAICQIARAGVAS